MKNKSFGTFEETEPLFNQYHDFPPNHKFIPEKGVPIYFTIFIALIVAFFTWEGIYFGAALTIQDSKIIMDESCFLGYWLFYQNITSDPKNFATEINEKLMEHSFFAKFAYHSKARVDHYLFDPMFLLGGLYFILPFFVIFRWIFACAFKKNQRIFDVSIYFTFYVFFLFGIFLVKTYFFVAFLQNSSIQCHNQFWNL